MNNVLLTFTTYNQLSTTKRCLEYAAKLGHDILVIDDHSTDDTIKYLRASEVDYLVKPKRTGLTHSWNIAYDLFKNDMNYDYMVLCNNDILIPQGAIDKLLSDYPLTVPMTSYDGAGYACKCQAVDFELESTFDPCQAANVQKVQDRLKHGFKKAGCWTGFCMCFSRDIIKYERDDGNLFDPSNVNTGNDDDLARRVTAMVSKGSFVHHIKGVSFGGKIADRNNLTNIRK